MFFFGKSSLTWVDHYHSIRILNLVSIAEVICSMNSKPSRKIGTAKRHLLELSWSIYRLRPKSYLFRNNLFLFFKIENWNFQHLIEKQFRHTWQNFNSFRQFLFLLFLSVVWLSWNFVRFHEILFKQMLKISAFKVLFLKNI